MGLTDGLHLFAGDAMYRFGTFGNFRVGDATYEGQVSKAYHRNKRKVLRANTAGLRV